MEIQQRDCSGFTPDSLLIRLALAWRNKTAAKLPLFFQIQKFFQNYLQETGTGSFKPIPVSGGIPLSS